MLYEEEVGKKEFHNNGLDYVEVDINDIGDAMSTVRDSNSDDSRKEKENKGEATDQWVSYKTGDVTMWNYIQIKTTPNRGGCSIF